MLLALLQPVTNAQSFSTPSSYESFENPTFAVAADFDGDGRIDLATANGLTDSVTFAFNNGTGSFPSRITYNSDPNPGWSAPEPLAIGDFNGDGKPDVAVGNGMGGPLSQGCISILLNNGDRTFAPAVFYNARSPWDIAVADVNADGKLDVVAASSATDNVSVLLGNGNGTFQAATTYPAADDPKGICIADFNGDAKPDLAVTHYSGNVLSILLGNGNGTFQAPVNYPAGTTPRGILAKDLNGDNKQDIVVAVPNSSAIYVYIGNGDGTFPAAVPYVVGGGSDVSIGDLNGDGKDDVATVVDVGNWSNPNLLKVLRGNGDGTFQLPAITQTTRGGSFSSTIADFDSDGKLDIAIVNPVFDVVDVYLNSPSARSVAINATVFSPVSTLVATLIDYDSSKTAGSFTATIDWGDGTLPSSGAISANGTGGFNVNGTHTYNSAGSFTVTTRIADSSGNFATATGSANVAKADQSITFGVLADKTFGDAPITVSATGGASGNPVTFVATGNCSSSGTNGTTITITGAGSCTVTASQAGNSNYNAAPNVVRSFNIAKANQTITFGSLSDKTFGDADFSVSAIATSGLTVSFAAAGQCTVTGTLVHLTGAGSCTITASQAGDTNYNAATPVNQSFNIGKAAAVVTLSNLTQIYDGNPKFATATTSPPGLNVTVTYSQNNQPVSSPANPGSYNVSAVINEANYQGSASGTLLITAVVIMEAGTNRVAALDSVTFVGGPFKIVNDHNFSADHRTRIIFFTSRLGLTQPDPAVLTVQAGGVPLNVEAVGSLSGVPGLDVSYVVVKLADGLAMGDIPLTITFRGVTSASGLIGIAP